MKCAVPVCDRPIYSRGFCGAHSKQLWRNGRVLNKPVRKMRKQGETRLCEVKDCQKEYFSTGKCVMHYSKETRRLNNEYKTRQILLEKGLIK